MTDHEVIIIVFHFKLILSIQLVCASTDVCWLELLQEVIQYPLKHLSSPIGEGEPSVVLI